MYNVVDKNELSNKNSIIMNQLFKSTILTIPFALIGMSLSAQCCNSDWNYTIPYLVESEGLATNFSSFC